MSRGHRQQSVAFIASFTQEERKMGAMDFSVGATGSTPEEAFRSAVEEALYRYGHDGYTGSIAEKSSFEMVRAEPGETASATVRRLIEDNDKWGPAYALELTEENNPKMREEAEKEREALKSATTRERALSLLGALTDPTEIGLPPAPPKERTFVFFGLASS